MLTYVDILEIRLRIVVEEGGAYDVIYTDRVLEWSVGGDILQINLMRGASEDSVWSAVNTVDLAGMSTCCFTKH